MRITSSDERDSEWERHLARYRVYFFTGGDRPGYSWNVETNDVSEAEVLEVVAWAQETVSEGGLYAVALVIDDLEWVGDDLQVARRGLTWLVGMDANDFASSPWEHELKARMHQRRGQRVVALPQPPEA